MGEMNMHSVTKTVEVDMEFVGRADFGRGDQVGSRRHSLSNDLILA